MSDTLSQAGRRLSQLRDSLLGKTATTIPFDPDSTSFPTRKNLPKVVGAPDEAAWVWGKDDFVGRLNLLTPTRVKAAAAAEIRTGEMARLDLPTNVPEQPAFGRQKFEHTIVELADGVAYDDVYHMNTQSGTQWDGFRHFAHVPTKTFYNNTHGADIVGAEANLKCSIHHWSTHGFSGRAVLLDYRSYADAHGIKYDTATSHAISYDDLVACGKYQNLDIRPAAQGGDIKIGDILLIRSGWTEDYYRRTPEERSALALRGHDSHGGEQQWAGIKQEEAVKDWLHDCYFAAVGGDAPSFERWPTPEPYYLHEFILALWGMPLGEMLDLEKAAQLAKKHHRWTFFFSSAPANCPGGVGSHVNGTAIF
jgi:kynurenine formamidase